MTKIRFQSYFCTVIWYVAIVQNTIASDYKYISMNLSFLYVSMPSIFDLKVQAITRSKE